ncbi:RNA ligase RtcB family protein [uncultured Roseibium sp.]|uniref:RNA ligase RtcB family protein n=1 Tax=uncultured Roseibium sp. TaxID=1936171 RepID=UPI0032174BC7
MGNSILDAGPADAAPASVHTFYSAASWIEGAAVDQLHQVAGLDGVRAVAAFPDLHPGKYGPVGSAILSERLYPPLIGNDIGCGMSLFALDLPARKLRLDKAAVRLRVLEGHWDGDAAGRLVEAGLAPDLHPQALGTIGGGNHFCELQVVDRISDGTALTDAGLAEGQLVMLVHSGSRSLGMAVFSDVDQAHQGLAAGSEEAESYLGRHHDAVAWARLNRQIIAERAASALRTQLTLIADAPHNLIEVFDGLYLHRKGAAKADGGLVPLAGSRDALSYLVRPTGSVPKALASLAHGSGRKYDRASMAGRAGATKSDRKQLERTSFGGYVVCEDRQLLIEEAPVAYKPSGQVLADLETTGLATAVAALKPLLTFKKAKAERETDDRQPWKRDRKRRGRS